jgi:hypothetical protein
MQPSARLQDTQAFAQPNHLEQPPDPAAVLRAYSGSVGLPSDRWKLDLQAQVVGAVIFVLAGIFLLMTVVLVLSMWLPAWLVTLGLTGALSALGLALFASVSRPPIYAPTRVEPSAAAVQDLTAIEEIDPTEVESMRGEALGSEEEIKRDAPRLTPHPIVAAEARDSDSDGDVDDAKTRPLGNHPPPPASGRQPLRAEMPSSASFNH